LRCKRIEVTHYFDLSGLRDVVGPVNDHLILQWPFSISGPLEWSLSPAVFEILRSKRIGVTSLTFQGHMTSSVM